MQRHYNNGQWRTQKLIAGGANEVFNHIFKGYGRGFCLKYTLNFFFPRGAAAHPGQRIGPPLTMAENDSLCNACLRPDVKNMTFYKCKFNGQGCNFVLHDRCTRLPAELNLKDYKGHPHHTLLLLPKAGDEFLWFECGVCEYYHNGFAYSCVQCNYKIGVWCAFIPKRIKHKSHPNHLLPFITSNWLLFAY
ncbi:hypothetical protein HanRHA438_Chr12g0538741 [Helianthus annuus]|nr:hypothetical protein HanOQP8_Chr12g0434871 [Helianthus annuus]KAJ0865272.1 hypothetical protein HanRHA438_Chr12g0538741 [Helianthus annuus]